MGDDMPLSEQDHAIVGLAACFEALAQLQGQPWQAAALREFTQMTFDLNALCHTLVTDVLGAVARHAGSRHREFEVVTRAFQLAAHEMLWVSQTKEHPTREMDQARAMQLFALAHVSLPVRDDGRRHLLYFSAFPLQTALMAAEASLDSSSKRFARTIGQMVAAGLEPVVIKPLPPKVAAPKLVPLVLAARTYVDAVYAEQGHAPAPRFRPV